MGARKKVELPIPAGTRVRFLLDNLGASERDDLGHVTSHVVNAGDTGVVAFAHPNRRMPQWFYVEVEAGEHGLLYVGVVAEMVEVLP